MANDVGTPGGGYGQPCDVLRENIRLNSASFSAVAGTDSDFWPEDAIITAMPLRNTHNIDTTAYTVGVPTETSWYHRVRGNKTQLGRIA